MSQLAPDVADSTTISTTLVPDGEAARGYRRLVAGPGEPHLVRRDLGGANPQRLRPLVCFLQLSDLHVTDAQSPVRAEFLDRLGDLDSHCAAAVGRVGLYRPQQALTAQVVEAMTRAIARVERGPLTGAAPDFAVSTGDATDNCQTNELASYLSLLDGGQPVTTDSGEAGRFEGVGAAQLFDRRYWHPDGSPDGEETDIPRQQRGFPHVPGLLDASLRPFVASGLPVPWFAVYGNHDALFGGTIPPREALVAMAVGDRKPVGLPDDADPLALLTRNKTEPPAGHWGLLSGRTHPVTPDHARRPVSRGEWIAGHLASLGRPQGHGLLAAPQDRAFYAFDVGEIRFLVLDTVNPAGGWQGSIDDEQFHWLEQQLVAGSSEFLDTTGRRVVHGVTDRLFVLFSHHPLETLTNSYGSANGRHLGADVRSLLGRFKNVAAWVNGHTHTNTIRPIVAPRTDSHPGFWQVTSASHIDWPQQSRIVEIAIDTTNGDIVIATAMIDHLGAVDPRAGDLGDALTLAGWSRELSANAWQGRCGGELVGRGDARDRNTLLVLPAPFAVSA
jgi:metallophosphoesterase (TIGR03767 family)